MRIAYQMPRAQMVPPEFVVEYKLDQRQPNGASNSQFLNELGLNCSLLLADRGAGTADTIRQGYRLRAYCVDIALNCERLCENELTAVGGIRRVAVPRAEKRIDRYRKLGGLQGLSLGGRKSKGCLCHFAGSRIAQDPNG